MCADFAALGTWGHEGSRSVIPKVTYPGLVEIVEATGEYAPKLFDQDSFLEQALTSGVVRGDFSVDDDVVVGSRGADMPATAMLRSFSFNNIHATVGQLFSPAVLAPMTIPSCCSHSATTGSSTSRLDWNGHSMK